MMLTTVVGISQTIGEAFYVYRNDGMINTFFRSEIDSIVYSYYDADSLLYEEIVSQVVYTPDSIYQIPLAVIDSVGFITPETRYQPNAIRLEGEIRDYILGSDSLIVYFRSDTPNSILPKIGDKLVTTEMSDVFEGGFLGQVESIAETNDTIILKCNMIGLDEVFECFYYSNSYEQPQSANRRRALSWNGSFSPGPFDFSLTNHLKAWLQPVDCPWKVTPKYDVKISPSFHSKGSIIVHPIKGVVINLDIKQQTAISQDIAMTGSISVSQPILKTGPIPLTAIVPFVWVYGEFGLSIGANMKVSMEQHWNQSLSYNIHYEASYLPALAIPTSIPKLSINGVNLTSDYSGKCLVEGSISGGIYGEIGIALLEKHVASAGLRLEGGLKLVGNAMIYDSETQQSLITTSLYDKLESSDVHLNAFCSVGLDAQLIHVGKAGINVFSKDWELTIFKLVPDFTNTTLARSSTNQGYLSATTTATGGAVFPCNLGFRLFEGNEDNSVRGTNSVSYWSLTDKTETISDEFKASALKKYKVYPTVDMGLGFEMIADPSAEIEVCVTPITLDVLNIEESSAKAYGKIEGLEYLDNNVQYGIGYTAYNNIYLIPAMDNYGGGVFSVNLSLAPNTTYEYFAYIIVDGKRYDGEKKEFTTKKHIGPYYVWDNANNSATFYYDDQCAERGGSAFTHLPYGWDYIVEKVIFDSSFSKYYPSFFTFIRYRELHSIENLNYLNTDSITDMQNMFYECSSLVNLDLSHFNTENVTNMGRMFYRCSSLTSLDLSNFNTHNVNDMGDMFNGCSSLVSLNVQNFNTANVTTMTNMFCGCSSLTSLDLSNFTVNNGSAISGMFQDCSSLITIYARDWNTGDSYCSPAPFSGCPNLRGGQGTKVGQNFYGYDENGNPLYYTCESYRTIFARIDGGKDKPGLFTAK